MEGLGRHAHSVPAGPVNQLGQCRVFIVDKNHAPSPFPAAVKVLISPRTCRALHRSNVDRGAGCDDDGPAEVWFGPPRLLMQMSF